MKSSHRGLRQFGFRRRAAKVAGAAVLGVALVAGASALPSAATASHGHEQGHQGLEVQTPFGKVRGEERGNSQAFLGLPFAQAPVYDLMWKAPVAPEKWKGVRDATEQAPACLQFEPTGVKNDQPTSLDCLYLDVYRPARIPRGTQLPVMVFYHGGAGTQGSGVLYGGQTLADRGDVIVVSTNYRLGASGTLALPALDAENPDVGGNFALLDQIEALKWVQQSISSFGGDVNNVTIFGQSAGGGAVCRLLATPLTEGLINRAVIQSSACTAGEITKEEAHASGQSYAVAAGCADGPNQLDCLRKAWPAALVKAQAVVNRTSAYTGTAVLPQSAGAAIADGNWHKVPVIVGNTRWEQKLQNQQLADITEAEYEAMVMEDYGDIAGPLVLAEYPASAYEAPFYALASMRTDAGAGCSVDRNAKLFLGQGVPVYRYLFEDPGSPTLFGFQPEGIDMSSAHSAELAYLFDFTLGDRPLTDQEQELGHSMQDYWAAFAKSGAPTARGELKWPAYTLAGDQAIVFAPEVYVTTGLYDLHNCAFFESLPAA
ncbi:carboxylesterase family protein [Arthrobacter sp. zg-Y1143]|uniref:carboxylesterase/lipase family protein n=1 Tax=Arthrobacter sp. zg-Y1143 TaxID=3049065 RepID=UPI0024C376C1|nr:carboxylesterase family protein [Arthrobacter sp. zg-Y1143]MDK1326542.1 carboxylesterase family protein [Arthrobacter sp. zg-Y1143]